MDVISRSNQTVIRILSCVLLISSVYGSSQLNIAEEDDDSIQMDLDLKNVQWSNKTVDKNLTLFGRINENITVGIFSSHGYNHMFTLFGTYVNNRCDLQPSHIQDDNDEVEIICRRLEETIWPRLAVEKNGTSSLFLNLVVEEIQSFGYENDTSLDSNETTEEFLNHFYFDRFIKKNSCHVFTKYQTEQRKNNSIKYLICLSPYIDKVQIDILYKTYFDEVAYVNYEVIEFLLSDIFYCLTLLVYTILPDMRKNIYGKCIFLYLISAIASCSGFSVTLYLQKRLGSLCLPIGFANQFSYLTTFTLQSLICIEHLLTVSSMRSHRTLSNKSNRHRMFWYCIYAYGFPAAVTLITIIMQFSPILNDDNPWKPNIGGTYCFFSNLKRDIGIAFLYFYGIQTALIIFNCLMFLVTLGLSVQSQMTNSYKSVYVSRESSRKEETSILGVHVKLFFVTGCNWISELFIVFESGTMMPNQDNWFLIFVDSFNNIIGVVLFIILVCNANTLARLKTRYFELFGKQLLENDSGVNLTSINDKQIKDSSFNINDINDNSGMFDRHKANV